MTEVFYYNTFNQLQQLKLHNMDITAFVDSTRGSEFKIFCILENGVIINTSPEFSNVEAELSSSLLSLLC